MNSIKTAIGQYIFSQEFGYGFDADEKTADIMICPTQIWQ